MQRGGPLDRHARIVDLAALLEEQRVDLIYDRTYPMTLNTAAAARRRPTARVSVIVSDPQHDFGASRERFHALKRRLLQRAYRDGEMTLAVSEGVHDAAGKLLAADEAKVERDAHGNVQLSGSGALAELLCAHIKARLGIKRVRGDTFGYLQRSFYGCVSDVDQREASCTRSFIHSSIWPAVRKSWLFNVPRTFSPRTSSLRWMR